METAESDLDKGNCRIGVCATTWATASTLILYLLLFVGGRGQDEWVAFGGAA
jgi:hypothetical protein